MFILNSEIIIVFPYSRGSFDYTINNFDSAIHETKASRHQGAYIMAAGPTKNRGHTKTNYILKNTCQTQHRGLQRV